MIVEGIRWKRVEGGSPDTLGDGELMRANVAGKTLCIVRNGGKLHALLDRCPHQGSSFIGGWCEGGDIICPLHRMGFNLATGRNRGGGTDSAEVFPVEERPDGVYIGFAYTTFKIFGVELW
ncbi:MAG: Rieske (2Fe-2S) protein [Flavobacteriales bacterium]|jgi:nitrite reductase/ring-hydroxylating ferredoxin subunit|nr:Rieske (2Fe-2S) protein [Flavobacteriales bacterium]MCI1753427.1 Rieske (2Fe-2S) protein [Flavobacteriales bacterium]